MKKVVASWCRLHPRNLFRESLNIFFDVWNHINADHTFLREIEVHREIIMLVAPDHIEFFIVRVLPVRKPF